MWRAGDHGQLDRPTHRTGVMRNHIGANPSQRLLIRCFVGNFRLQSHPAARYRTPFSRGVRQGVREHSMVMQVISVVGALMVLVAYGLIQAGTWRELDAGYLALNILGSLLLGIVAIEDRRVGFVLLEFAWAGIALVGVARAIRARRAARSL